MIGNDEDWSAHERERTMSQVTHVEQIFDGAVGIVEAGLQGAHDLLTLKAHFDHVLDRRLQRLSGEEVTKRALFGGLDRCGLCWSENWRIGRLRCSGRRNSRHGGGSGRSLSSSGSRCSASVSYMVQVCRNALNCFVN